MTFRILATLVFTLLAAAPAHANKVRIATVHLTDSADKDIRVFPGCDSPANVVTTKLMLEVNAHSADIRDLDVWYHNGEHQDVRVRDTFAPGSSSRWIDLSGEARCIQKIKIKGDANTVGRTPGKQARVTFYAWNPDWVDDIGDAHRLASVRLTDALDRDVMQLGECPSKGNKPVRSLKFKVKDYAAEVNRVRVVYGNGTDTEVAIHEVFEPGQTSRWHDLPGDARCVDKIVIIGDTESLGRRPGRQAEIVAYGR